MPRLLTDMGESRCRGAPHDAFNNHEFRENQCSESCGLFNGLHGGFGGLRVACWPLVPKFAGSNPAEAVGFFRARLPLEGK
jgi:hypothetical protein